MERTQPSRRPTAVDRAPPARPRTGTCAAARSPDPGPILSRFCRDHGLSRDNSPNSGSNGPLRSHTYHITNIDPLNNVTITLRLKWNPATPHRRARHTSRGVTPRLRGWCSCRWSSGRSCSAAAVTSGGTAGGARETWRLASSWRVRPASLVPARPAWRRRRTALCLEQYVHPLGVRGRLPRIHRRMHATIFRFGHDRSDSHWRIWVERRI